MEIGDLDSTHKNVTTRDNRSQESQYPLSFELSLTPVFPVKSKFVFN